jgi:putative ABC transport system permease protein
MTESTTIDITLAEVAASLGLVVVAIAVSRWRRAELEGDIAVAVGRSMVQLFAIGYVIQAIFDSDSLLLVFALIAVMVLFGAFTARKRAAKVPNAFVPLLIALGLAGSLTLGLVVLLGIFEPEPRYLVPVGGMVAQSPWRRHHRVRGADRSHPRARRDGCGGRSTDRPA